MKGRGTVSESEAEESEGMAEDEDVLAVVFNL